MQNNIVHKLYAIYSIYSNKSIKRIKNYFNLTLKFHDYSILRLLTQPGSQVIVSI